MGRKRRSNGEVTTKAKAAPGATIKKMESYEDTLQEGGVDDCESRCSPGLDTMGSFSRSEAMS